MIYIYNKLPEPILYMKSLCIVFFVRQEIYMYITRRRAIMIKSNKTSNEAY